MSTFSGPGWARLCTGTLLLCACGYTFAQAKTGKMTESLADSYRQEYNLKKAAIEENSNQQASGRFELRGLLAIPSRATVVSASSTVSTPDAETRALKFFNDNKDLFDISRGETDLRLHSNQSDNQGSQHLRYHRYLGPLQLQGMEVIVHIDRAGNIEGINGNIVRVSKELDTEISFLKSLGTLPKLDQTRLLELAAQNLNTQTSNLNLIKSQAFASNSPPYLVWQIEINRRGRLRSDIFTIDDTAATVIRHRTSQRHQF